MLRLSGPLGGAAILCAIFLVAAVLPYQPRTMHAELTSLADQPSIPLSLNFEDAPSARARKEAALSLPRAPARAQQLIYIVPEHHEKMGDYFDFMNACKAACGPSATLAYKSCGADSLGPIYVDYLEKCRKDVHECSCQITSMYCGQVPHPSPMTYS